MISPPDLNIQRNNEIKENILSKAIQKNKTIPVPSFGIHLDVPIESNQRTLKNCPPMNVTYHSQFKKSIEECKNDLYKKLTVD